MESEPLTGDGGTRSVAVGFGGGGVRHAVRVNGPPAKEYGGLLQVESTDLSCQRR